VKSLKTKSHRWIASGQSQPFNFFINISKVQIHLFHSGKGLTFSMVNATLKMNRRSAL